MAKKEGAVLDHPTASLTKKRLNSHVTGETPTPQPGTNLFIRIDVGTQMATFHCRKVERMTSSSGTVKFEADALCTVNIENPSVIQPAAIPLAETASGHFQGTGQIIAAGETSFYVSTGQGAMAEQSSRSTGDPRTVVPSRSPGDPRIIVP